MSFDLPSSISQAENPQAAKWASYRERISLIHCSLGIPDDYTLTRQTPLYWENSALVNAGRDYIDRDLFLSPKTAEAWNAMRAAAASECLTLIPVSGFRSVERQRDIIAAKLLRGRPLHEVLQVNAPPGYSQHHSGCALDLTDSETCKRPLNEDFESQPAFRWLEIHSSAFGFRMEYPRGNRYNFVYEPWHWVFTEVDEYTLPSK